MADSFTKNDRFLGQSATDGDGKKGFAGLTSLSAISYANVPADANAGSIGFLSNPTNLGVGMALGAALLVYNGTALVTARGDTNGTVIQSALSSTFWNYAAASGGIVNTTTAVTIKAAAGAAVRNYLKTLTIGNDLLGAATELAIRDGAAGTVLWRGKVQTAATQDRTITFDPPLKGTANTLMEVVTLTASVSGGVFVNATGFTGT